MLPAKYDPALRECLKQNCIYYDGEKNSRCMNPPTNWIRSHPHQSERDTVLDDLCNIDLTYYIWGEKQSDEVGLCRGRTCNYCGRYNVELLQQAGVQR